MCLMCAEKLDDLRGDLLPRIKVDQALLAHMMKNSVISRSKKAEILKVCSSIINVIVVSSWALMLIISFFLSTVQSMGERAAKYNDFHFTFDWEITKRVIFCFEQAIMTSTQKPDTSTLKTRLMVYALPFVILWCTSRYGRCPTAYLYVCSAQLPTARYLTWWYCQVCALLPDKHTKDPLVFFQQIADVLESFLVKLFNRSLSEGLVPSVFKAACNALA